VAYNRRRGAVTPLVLTLLTCLQRFECLSDWLWPFRRCRRLRRL